MKNKVTTTILLTALLMLTNYSCRKGKIDDFPKKIIGFWSSFVSGGSLFSPAGSRNAIFLSNGTWFSIAGRISAWDCFEQKESDCMPVIDKTCMVEFIKNWGHDLVSDTLEYFIKDDTLILLHHEDFFDKTTQIVTSTFIIKKIRNCKTNKGAIMILIDPVTGKKIEYFKMIYKKSYKRCVSRYPCY